MIRTREIELLLSCSRPQMNSESVDKICLLLQEDMDWDWVLNAARSHGVWPILYRNLNAVYPEAVPENIRSDLQKAYLFNAGRNLMFTRELLRIVKDFQEHGIESIPFKGPALAQMAYEDIALRQFSDLDIIVHKQDVLKVKDLLISGGYEPQIGGHEITHLQERMLLKDECEYDFVRRDPLIPVEVHWRVHPSKYSVPFDEGIWSRLETMNLDGVAVNSFLPEDLVLALCSHATRHQWTQMKMVSDVAGLIERCQIDWEHLNMIARDSGLKRILHIGLLLAHDLLDVGFPEQMIGEIEGDGQARKLALRISGELFARSSRQKGLLEEFLFWPKTRERLMDKTRYLIFGGIESNTGDWNAFPLPDPLFFLYRIVRPVRLFCKYGFKRKRE